MPCPRWLKVDIVVEQKLPNLTTRNCPMVSRLETLAFFYKRGKEWVLERELVMRNWTKIVYGRRDGGSL